MVECGANTCEITGQFQSFRFLTDKLHKARDGICLVSRLLKA